MFQFVVFDGTSVESSFSFLRFVGIAYIAMTLSFRLGFSSPYDIFSDKGSHVVAIFFDYAVDFFYLFAFIFDVKDSFIPRIIDVSLASIRNNHPSPPIGSFEEHSSNAILENIQTRRHILGRGNIIVEIIGIIPWEIIAYASGMQQYYALRLLKLIRIKNYFNYWNNICRTNDKEISIFSFLQNPVTNRVVLLAITMAVIGHVTACLFFYFSLQQLKSGNSSSWVFKDGLVDAEGNLQYSVGLCYLRALYWSIQTLDTVGIGDIIPYSEGETWFCILYFYISAYLIYYSIANLMTIITDLDASRTRSIVLKAKFTKYAAYRKLPTHLTQRVFSYYEYQWRQLKGLSEPQVNSVNTCNILNKISCTFYS